MARKVSRSVLKRIRQNEKRRLRNKAYKSMVKTLTKKFLSETDPAQKEALLREVYAALDKGVSKGIFHENTAARKKSKLARHLQTFLAQQQSVASTGG